MMCQINVTKAFIDIVAVATVPQRTNEKLLGGWIWYTRCFFFFFVSLKYLLHFLFFFLWLQRRFNICCSPLEFFLFLFFYIKIFFVLCVEIKWESGGEWWLVISCLKIGRKRYFWQFLLQFFGINCLAILIMLRVLGHVSIFFKQFIRRVISAICFQITYLPSISTIYLVPKGT